MVKKETKNYQTPTIKVVQFKVELGNLFSSGSTGGVTDDFKMIEPNPTNGQYIRREQGWDGFTEM